MGSFTTGGYGIFNERTHVATCRTHERGSGTSTSAQEMTRRDTARVPHPAATGDPTQGLRVWIPIRSLTTELRPAIDDSEDVDAAHAVAP